MCRLTVAPVRVEVALVRCPTLLGCVVLLALLPRASTAQQVTPQDALAGADQAKGAVPEKLGTLAAAATFGRIDEDWYATLMLRLSFDQPGWGLGVQLPLRLRVFDAAPEDPSALVIREEDWDEPADYLKVLRYVYLGNPDKSGPYYLRVGELSGLTLGHGTIMHRFSNGFDLDRFRLGGDFHVRVGPYSAELVVGDLARPQDTVVTGVRFTVRPLILAQYHGGGAPAPSEPGGARVATSSAVDPSAGATTSAPTEPPAPIDPDGWAARLVTGLTIMTDPTAPRGLACTPKPGADVAAAASPCDPRYYRVALEDNHPQARNDEVVAMIGVDAAYELVRGDLLSITPYLDINNLLNVENGWGLHLGVLWGLRVPLVLDTFTVDLRTEYRRVSGDYVGPYFDSTYAVERLESPAGSGLTKLQSLRTPVRRADGTVFDPRQSPAKNGLFFDVLAGLPNYVYVGGEYVDYDGGIDDGTLRLSLMIPALTFLQLNAFYLRTRVADFGDLFALDDRSAIVAEAVVPVYGVLNLQARWWRLWRASADGNYTSVDDYSIGVGISLDL